MAQHVDVDREEMSCRFASPLDHPRNTLRLKGSTALVDEHMSRSVTCCGEIE